MSSSTQASATSRTSTPSGTPKPTTNIPRTTGASTSSTSTAHSSVPFDESEWARRQAEHAKKQQEQFRREQERVARERETKAGRIMTKDEVMQLFAAHERVWSRLPDIDDLGWDSFPWPTLKRPLDPEEITTTAISAYVLSPHGDKTRSTKERVKEHIRRWHPDRFETKLLPKVRANEREKVKQGAGVVARGLNELLTRSHDFDIFS